MGSGLLRKTTVIYHSPVAAALQIESLLRTKKAILGQSLSKIVQKKVCCDQMSPHFHLFLRKIDVEFSVPKTKGTIQTFTSRSKHLSWGPSVQTAWVTHMCEGTIDMEAYIGMVQRHILPSRWLLSWEVMVIRSRQCQVSFCMCYNTVVW